VSICSAYSTVYLVVDALDECTDRNGARKKFVNKLRELQAMTPLRLLITSRFNPEIEKWFKSDLKLEIRASSNDVRRYVAGQVPRLPNCVQRNCELIQEIPDRIAEDVDGMFLYLARPEYDIN
jgi:hypothetical protein